MCVCNSKVYIFVVRNPDSIFLALNPNDGEKLASRGRDLQERLKDHLSMDKRAIIDFRFLSILYLFFFDLFVGF